jgi:ATP-dependent DNA helicase RecG
MTLTLTLNEALVKLGLTSHTALIHYYPKTHTITRRSKISEAKVGDCLTLVGQVVQHRIFDSKNGDWVIQTWTIANQSKTHSLTCTHFHRPEQHPQQCSKEWRSQQTSFYHRALVQVSGKIKRDDYGGGLMIESPEVIKISPRALDRIPAEMIQPVYRLTKGLDADTLSDHILVALLASTITDPFPSQLRERYGLVTLDQAICDIHTPPDSAALEAARRRLVFDEFFYLQLALLWRRHQLHQQAGQALSSQGGLLNQFYDILPFSLTAAQQRVISEILSDLAQPQPMNRLVQGDVGSGKTVVAVAACLSAIESGYQTALMAPTEVLAEQHFIKIHLWFETLGLTAELLTGSTSAKERKSILARLEAGEIDCLIGTHALIQDKVTFQNLGLAVIDEQHRFGVAQRVKLQQKGNHPHLLSMTATPIPRTLALTLYGDLDVSQIDELPPGRKPIRTKVIDESTRPFLYQAIAHQLRMGCQVYVILPLVSQSKQSELTSATEAFTSYQRRFSSYQVGLLHGRLSSEEKSAALNAFRANQTQILVSTTVIEVGVDVPNATLMVVEHAERFGLSQLHQLRGRVGRGDRQSYCLLVDTSGSSETRERLDVMVSSNDGFVIAEADLQLRGSGEILGIKQAGTAKFALANLARDASILEQARKAAQQIVQRNKSLHCWRPLLAECDRRGHLEQAQLQPHLN